MAIMKFFLHILLLILFANYCFGQGVAIQNDRDNILYFGVPNSFKVVAQGFGPGPLIVTSNGGEISNDDYGRKGWYNILPDHVGNIEIVVKKKSNRGLVRIYSQPFRVKNIPDPILKLSNNSGGYISASLARVQIAPFADRESDFGCGRGYIIDSFTIIAIRQGQVALIRSLHNPAGTRFTDDEVTADFMKTLKSGDKLVFTGIDCIRSDAKHIHLKPMEFILTE